jgi:Arc/MetJ-type ribon-helix-helix transcriptional regulator
MMSDKRVMTLELPAHIAAELEARVAAGHARSESDAVTDAVERTVDDGLRDWITTEGAARYDRVMAGEATLSPRRLTADIDRRRRARLAAAGGR